MAPPTALHQDAFCASQGEMVEWCEPPVCVFTLLMIYPRPCPPQHVGLARWGPVSRSLTSPQGLAETWPRVSISQVLADHRDFADSLFGDTRCVLALPLYSFTVTAVGQGGGAGTDGGSEPPGVSEGGTHSAAGVRGSVHVCEVPSPSQRLQFSEMLCQLKVNRTWPDEESD